uniref:NADH dehydrogenase [ubiquinone] 1 beta subcomplex subunit 4 n=2 Tax=Lygus hesperus TaxID=30085 RepID=A0A146LYW6_LYGHE
MADLARLVAEKNKQRAALKKEYFKLLTNPNAEGGHVFDPAVQRHGSMRVTRINHFRETPKNLLTLCLFVVLPLAGTVYLIKTSRDEKEAAIRSGTVAYKDRLFKLQ